MALSVEQENMRALVKDIAGEVRAEMQVEAEKFIATLETRYGASAIARKAGIDTDFLRREGLTPNKERTAKEYRVGRAMRALAGSRGNVELAKNLAKARGDLELEAFLGRAQDEARKAMSLSDFAAGGALVPEEFSQEVIGLLYPALTVSSLGADVVPMPNGQLTIPYLDTGVTAYYVGELQNITPSQQVVGQIQLSAKKLAAVVPVSNDLLKTGSARADAMIQKDLINRLRVRADLAFLRGTGASGEPRGVRNFAIAGNIFAQSGLTLADKVTDLGKMQRVIQENDVQIEGGGYIMAPRTSWALKNTVDALGNFIFLKGMEAGMLMGQGFRESTAVPINLSGSNSEIVFGAFAHVIIGDTETIEVSVHPDGAYHDGSNVQSGVSQDSTPVRAIARHDLACRYRGKEISVITGTTWA